MKYRPLVVSALLLAVSLPAFSWGPVPDRDMTEEMQTVIKETLKLDSKREKQLQNLLTEQQEARTKLMEKHKALREEGKKQRTEFKEKMDKLLTDEEHQALREAMRKKMHESRHGEGKPMKGKKHHGDMCDDDRALFAPDNADKE